MARPIHVTFTGLDEQTDLSRVVYLSKRYPIEWGVLVGGRLGKARYPSLERINEISLLAQNCALMFCALHLCGLFAAQANAGKFLAEIDLKGFRRIQVNALKYNMEKLSELSTSTQKSIIIQHRDGPFPEDLPLDVYPLHDCSGGKGRVPTSRPEQVSMKTVGYAGGITPENVQEVIDQIDGKHFWIDMESGVRTEDRFDLDKCEAICRTIWG